MIIGFSGNIGVGKTTLANVLKSELERIITGDVIIISLSQKVYEEVLAVYEKAFVNRTFSLESYADFKITLFDLSAYPEVQTYFGTPLVSGRQLLQYHGTDVRRKQDKDYWINAVLMDINYLNIYIIDDIRFKNEMSMCTNLIHISDYTGYIKQDNHPAENQILVHGIDLIIDEVPPPPYLKHYGKEIVQTKIVPFLFPKNQKELIKNEL